MITPTVKTGQPLRISTKVGVKRFIFVRSTKYQEQSRKYEIRSTELRKYQEARDKKQEARNKSQEARDPVALRFLCVSAPLRAKGRKRQVERSKNREPRTEKQETRAEKQEPRDEKQDVRVRLDFFASLRLCEQ